MRLVQSFEPEPGEVHAARHFVASTLADWGLADGDVSLLVSEIATNAVLHARSDFAITVIAELGRIRIEVFDRNTRLPTMAGAGADAFSGRGLMLVQVLSTSWGVEPHANRGKTVWFEVAPAEHAG